jgi:hypothetical protein
MAVPTTRLRANAAVHARAMREQSGRARIREALLKDTARLTFPEAVPPLDAADMCSECPTPAAWHSLTVTFNLDPSKDAGDVGGRCPAWPWWRERLEGARRQLLALVSPKAKPPAATVPMPIAVIDPGLPIEEVIARLSAVQADHPGAQHGAAGSAGRSGRRIMPSGRCPATAANATGRRECSDRPDRP